MCVVFFLVISPYFQVIVVGGGLAGLSAAHTVLQRGGRCLVLDKKDFLGGNSVKATSGINGAGTSTQAKQKVPDSSLIFFDDSALSAAGGKKSLDAQGNLPLMPTTYPLVKVLTHNSGSAVEWLIDHFGLDLSLISRLGGHSFPRTHRGGERFPGMTITYALMEKFDDIARVDSSRARVITQARVTKLIQEGDKVVGVEYEKDGKLVQEYGPVVLATGGYGADFGSDSLLAKHRPDLLHLPTTNGDHCTGDGVKMALQAGGSSVDLNWVQVHPTGLVHPKEPDNKVKFLAAEALRGVGGLMLDNKGQRFCDELGTRDYVTGRMWEEKVKKKTSKYLPLHTCMC